MVEAQLAEGLLSDTRGPRFESNFLYTEHVFSVKLLKRGK